MEALKNAEALPIYPSSSVDVLDGKYGIRSAERGYVESHGSDIESNTWFKTPPLEVKTIKRLRSIQLITESHDQGWCSNRADGNWTWFEISILENANTTEPRVKDDVQLTWESHKNQLKSKHFVQEQNVIAVRGCSRFSGWKLVAKQRYLVVELGAPVEREPLSFGTIAAKVLNTLEAFNDVNELSFPDLEEFPSVPATVFRADRMGTEAANERPLRVLSLDGGGVRGLASLIVLKAIMDHASPGKKPCEVFDMIGGTSTGGLIAIMLGRLEMSVQDCIGEYETLVGKVFPPPQVWSTVWSLDLHGWWASALFSGEKWKSQDLEVVIKDLVRRVLNQDPETVLLQDPKNPNPSCKVFVTASREKRSNNLGPVLLRSYSNPDHMPEFPEVKLWQAARATSAAPAYFKPIEINGESLIDGGVQANNPLGWLWTEVIQVFPPVRTTDCFLSIGTGVALSQHALSVFGITGLLTNSNIVNILFRELINGFAPRGLTKKYWGFDFGDGLPDWVEEDGVMKWVYLAKVDETGGQMDDITIKELLEKKAADYINEPGFQKQLDDCATALRANPRMWLLTGACQKYAQPYNRHCPCLYVIYAGRGDAMYIEWTDRTEQKHLVLLDGGPFKYQVIPKKSKESKGPRPGGNVAPYSKYLFAAGQRIWKTRFSATEKFTPSAIINSHPHDDHLAGLLAFLRFAVDKRKDDFDFKGYFYQPNCPGSNFEYEGIHVDFPKKAKSIVNWKVSTTGLPTAHTINPDGDDQNLQSILMRTVPGKMKVGGTMYFTGDSVGYKIAEMFKKTPPGMLSIYKIQHHGSLRNTQIQDQIVTIKRTVGQEAVLRTWLNRLTDTKGPPWKLQTGVRELEAVLVLKFKEMYKDMVLSDYQKRLNERHAEYIECFTKMKPGDESVGELKGLHSTPSEFYTDVVDHIKELKGTQARPFYTTAKPRKLQDWWKKATDLVDPGKEYLDYMLVFQIRNFFLTFIADAYVISANHAAHDHPSPPTILGLALAIKHQLKTGARARGGVLYVTDGSAIDLEGLEKWAKNWGISWPGVISESLTIKALKNRCFMSLDASDDFKGPDREKDGATEEISFSTTEIAERTKFTADVEADTSYLGHRDLGPIFCGIFTPKIATTTTDLYLSIESGTPKLIPSVPTVATPRLLVEYCWITQGTASMKDENEAYHLVVRQWVTDEWRKMDIWMENTTAEFGNDTKTMLYWKVADKKKAFYIKTAASTTIEIEDHKNALPLGYQNVFFIIQLEIDIQPVMSPIPRLPYGPQSFRSFCSSSMLEPATISSAWKAIEALTSSEIVMALDLNDNFETTVLNYQIDLEKSDVNYEYDEVSVEVQSANLIFQIPDNATIKIGSEAFLVKGVTFDLSWDQKDLIKARLDIKTMTKGIEVVVPKEVQGAKHASTLRKSLIGMGVNSEELTKVRLAKLIGYLINSDSKMYSLLYQETPASLLLSGILRLVPDLDRSRARVTMLPGNMPLIHQVDIKCYLDTAVGVVEGESKPKTFDPNITFAGVNLVIQTLGLSVYNATSPDETIVSTGTAKFVAAKKQGLTVNLRCVIEGQDGEHPEVEFTIDGTQSLHDLVTELSGTMSFTEAVPLNGKGFTLQSLGTSQVGFAVTQPVTAHSHCVLSRIWAVTDFSEWQNFLPSSFPKVQGDVKVQVYNPLDANHISVGVVVNYKTRMDTTPPCDIDVTFFANPLPKSDSYEFRLWLSPSNRTLTVYGILEAMGVTDRATFGSALETFPMIEKSHSVLIHRISFAVENSTLSGWKFGDWSLCLGVSNVTILPDVLTLQSGTLDMAFLDDAYHCSIQADFVIEKIETVVSASFKLPQKDAVGSLNIDIPDGLSVSDIINALELPNKLHHLPLLVKSILEVHIRAEVLGCELGFNWDDGMDVGVIGLNSVKVDILYTSSKSPLGTGKTEYGFTIAAMFNKNSVMAQLSYKSAIDELDFSLHAVNTVLYFKLELGEKETVKVDDLTMTGLLIEYTAGVMRLPERRPTSLLLVGQVRSETAAARITISCTAKHDEPAMVKASLEPISKQEPLTLTGLLGLFSFSKPTFIQPEERPEKCPDFFSLNVVEVSATMEVREATTTERGTFVVRELDAVAVSTGTLTVFDTVKLQNIGLGVHYTKKKDEKNASITAEVVGDLIIQSLQGPKRVAYIQTAEGKEFHGVHVKQDAAPPMSFEKMAGQFLSPDKYTIPEHLVMPKIGLQKIEVHLVINKSLKVSGVGGMHWNHESNGVAMYLAELGGEITVKKTNQGSLLLPEGMEYDAFITGKLTITDFVSQTDIRARLRIGSAHAPVLTAKLDRTTNDNKELVRLSQNMSSSKQLAWDRVEPRGTAAISFPSTDVYMYAYLSKTKGKLFLCAHIDDLGDATIFARPDINDTTRHSYFFSVSCTNLSKIWDKTKEPAMSTFRLSQIGAQIIGYHGTVGGLMDELILVKTAASAEDIKIEDSSSILTTMNKEDTLDPGGWFFATVQLQKPEPSALVKALEGSMSLNQGEVITLFAKIDNSDQARTIYGMSVNNLYLLGGTMVISGQGTYTPALDTRKPSILVQGQMKVLGLFTEPFTIDVGFGVTLQATRFSLKGTAPPGPLRKPLGAMFNVEIKLASIYGVIEHTEPKRTTYVFKGSGSIGSSSLKFSSLVIFDQDLKPTVVAFVLDTDIPDPKLPALKQRDLTTDDVFKHIIQPNSKTSPSWPTGYSGLVFKAATVYYASKTFLDNDQRFYEQGYHVSALVRFFGYGFTVSASIPLDQSGLKVAATYEGTVDLSFAKFNKTTVSIITSKDDNATVYGAQADLTLLTKSGFHIDLKYERGHDRYSATGSYLGTDKILGLSNPTVALTYNNKTGLMSIDNWRAYQDLKDVLSTVAFAEGLKEASAKEMTCEKIVELIFKETITTQYNMEFKGASVNDTHLLLNLSGTWDVKIALEPPVTIAAIPLPDISVQVSKKLSLEQLGVAVVKLLADNISSIAVQLLQQPAKLAAFFGALVVKEYVQQTITALICRKVNERNVRDRADDPLEENESAPRTFTTPPTREFLGAPSVWTWVRAKATFGKTEVQGSWQPAQTLTHVPSMTPPKEVRLDGPPVVNGSYLTVSMPPVAPGDYRFCIVTQDDLTASRPLYSSTAHIPATIDFTKQVRVIELEACPLTTTGMRAVAKTLSSDPSKFHDSPYTYSQSLETLPLPLNLTASMSGLTAMAIWDLPGQSQDDCELVVLNAVTVEPETTATIQFQPTKDGHRLASVQGPTFQEGYHIVLAARQKSTKVSAIGLYTTLPFVVSNIPLWAIDARESYYDISSKTLSLNINSASRAAGPLTFEVLLSGVTTVTPSSTQLSDQSTVLHIPNIRTPYPSTVQVRTINAANVRGTFGVLWKFPSVPQDLPAPQPKISYTAGILTLTWPCIPVANVRVLVWVQDSKTMKVLSTKVTPPSATSLTLSSQDFLIVPGMNLILTCYSTLENIRGSMARLSYEIADMNKGWGTPHELIIPAPQSKVTYSAVTTYSVPQPMDSTLFWASNSAQKITKLDWNTGYWLASTVPVQGTDLQEFCSINNTSRHSGHKEFFYIKQDGTIGGFLYLGTGGGWSPQTYAFATETANLNNGGVIDAVSLNTTTSLLCWVARDGALRCSVWGSSTNAWSVASYAAEPQSGTSTEAGFIRATSQNGKGVHVFYRGKGGDLRGVFCNLVSDTGSMTWKGFTIHTEPDARPRGSSLCVSGVGKPIRIFWSSVTDIVVEAHREGQDLDSWKVQYVSSPGSVGTSNMTAVYRDNTTMCLWWITPTGAICRGDGNISTDGKISDWTITKQLHDGTALSTTASPWPPGVVSNFYTTSHSSVMSIFWVSPDQVLMGQTWSREH
ncbi:calcium-independent phospholipase A2-gamma [Fusarium bulbicola]|nr:calcium-independent phospholipase A2-gamma [Fusarium bulbicola]